MKRITTHTFLIFLLCTLVLADPGDKGAGYQGAQAQQNKSYFNETVKNQLLLYNNMIDLERRFNQLVKEGMGVADSDVLPLIDECSRLQQECCNNFPVKWDAMRNLFFPKRSSTVGCGPADMLRAINDVSIDILALIEDLRVSIQSYASCINTCTKLVGWNNQNDGQYFLNPDGLTITQPGVYFLREYVDASGLAATKPTIIIQSEDVTFDFRDNTLIPNDNYSSTPKHGIWVQRSNVEVRDGSIVGSVGSKTAFNAGIVVESSSGERLSNIAIANMFIDTDDTGCGIAMHEVDDARITHVRTGKCEDAGYYLRGCNRVLVEDSFALLGSGDGFVVSDSGGETSSGLVFRNNIVMNCGDGTGKTEGGFLIDNGVDEANISALLIGNTALSNIAYGFKITKPNTTGNVQLLNNFSRSGNIKGSGVYVNYINYDTTAGSTNYTPQILNTSRPFGINIGV